LGVGAGNSRVGSGEPRLLDRGVIGAETVLLFFKKIYVSEMAKNPPTSKSAMTNRIFIIKSSSFPNCIIYINLIYTLGMLSKRVDGKKIAEEILENLHRQIITDGIKPHLVVFLIGDNPSSQSYIRQKKNATERIGALFTLQQYPATVAEKEIKKAISQANASDIIHGIIIQRPLPKESVISSSILDSVALSKDIDGFLPGSPYEVPVAHAVITILEHVYQDQNHVDHDFISWLRTQRVAVIGKGITAGGPIRSILEKFQIPVLGIDRSTEHPSEITKKSDIIISCVGKEHTVTAHAIKQDVILLSVGLSRGQDGKNHGDYEEEDILEKASVYTPTPGGVGPVNVACLMQNLVKASVLARNKQ